MASLRSRLIRLAHEKPQFRSEILPLLKKAGTPTQETRDLVTLSFRQNFITGYLDSMIQEASGSGVRLSLRRLRSLSVTLGDGMNELMREIHRAGGKS